MVTADLHLALGLVTSPRALKLVIHGISTGIHLPQGTDQIKSRSIVAFPLRKKIYVIYIIQAFSTQKFHPKALLSQYHPS
jgi:hypothetical protein